MSLLKYFWLCYASSFLQCTTAIQVSATKLSPTAPLNLSSGPESSGHPNRISRLLSDIPKPTRNQTIGSYFDTLLGNSLRVRSLGERNLLRSNKQALLTSLWEDGQGSFNVSLDKCLEFKTVAGIYTSRDGTRNKATILDINNDLRFRLASVSENEQAMGARVTDNAKRALLELERYLQTAVCGYTVGTDAHNELRHLLALDGQQIALLGKSVISGSVSAALYTGLFNKIASKNATTEQNIAVGIAGVGITYVQGIFDRFYTGGRVGRVNFLEATILLILTAWFRQVAQVASDKEKSTCIPEEVVQDAIGSLPGYSDRKYNLNAITEVEVEQTCRA